MTQNNDKIFRRILKILGIVCVFLLGCVSGIPVSPYVFGIVFCSSAGLFVGYLLGTDKDLRFWKNFKVVKKDDNNKK